MPLSYEFCDERAREAASEAKEATLNNVRERSLRAEKTWRSLADRARAVALERQEGKRKTSPLRDE